MDSRTAAHVLSQIASYLELRGDSSFKCRAYRGAAKALLATGLDELAAMYRSGELATLRGFGPATLAVVRDLIETGESRYLEQLRESTPEGLLEMLDIPGLNPARVHQIHEGLGIDTIEELETAARDGRLASLPRYGPRTAAKILKGIAFARENGRLRLYHHALAEARVLAGMVAEHPDVERVEITGSIRRKREVAGDVDLVASCRSSPATVLASIERLPGVRSASGGNIQFVDGARLDLRCVEPGQFGVALFRTTGTAEHVDLVVERLGARGLRIDNDRLLDGDGRALAAPTEDVVYRAAGLAEVPPELREATGEIEVAARGALPRLLTDSDIRGVLHCHSLYSDGKAGIADLARAARERGWSFLGVSDHSQAAFYAGGLSPEQVRAQHDEIDELNAGSTDFRVLKGIEADILADGRLDYDDDLLASFDYVIGSIHSRFSMDGTAMTERILAALEHPRLTVLAHPTGRLLLSREPYALDLGAVFESAAERGVAVELNCDPARMDLDWRQVRRARDQGVTIAIGPDAHSVNGLDNVAFGVASARKAWLEPANVLNARSADEIVAFAAARRRTSDTR